MQRTYANCNGLPTSLELAVACCVQLLLHRKPAMTASYSQTVWTDHQSFVCGDVFRISKILEDRGWAHVGVPFPLLMDGFLVRTRISVGRGQTILLERERIKRDTIKQRRLNHHAKAA